jgi:hypothetical protein
LQLWRQGFLVQILRLLIGALEELKAGYVRERNTAEVFSQFDDGHVEPVKNTDHPLLHVEAPLQLTDGKVHRLISEFLHLVKAINSADKHYQSVANNLFKLRLKCLLISVCAHSNQCHHHNRLMYDDHREALC